MKGNPLPLFDLCRLLGHYWKLAIAIIAACSLSAALASWLIMPQKYEASASITVSDPSGSVSSADMLAVANSLAQSEAAPYNVEGSDTCVSVSPGTGATSQVLTIVAESTSEDETAELANSLANSVAAKATGIFEALQEANEDGRADLSALNSSEDVASVLSGSLMQDILGTGLTFEFCSFMVNEAVEAQEAGLGGVVLVALGLIGGLFVAVVAVMVIAAIKEPIRSRDELEEATGLPVLNGLTSRDAGDQIWANVQFSSDELVDSLCLVPVAGDSGAQECATALVAAIERANKSVMLEVVTKQETLDQNASRNAVVVWQCPPLAENVAAAYCAHNVSVTLVCARFWSDSLGKLQDTIRELSLAKAKVAGVVLLAKD